MEYKNLAIEQEKDFARVLINRPRRGNSLSDALVGELIDFFSRVPSETGARIAVIRGVGEKCFCAGADVGELGGKSIQEQREGFSRLAFCYETIRKSQMISIAAVNGLALGGGLGLVSVCDLAITSKTANFGLPEINLGMAPLVVLLPVMRSIGTKTAFFLASRGKTIGAEEALRMGLVSSVVEEGKLDEEAANLARELADKSGVVLSLMKQGIQEADPFNYSQAYAYLKELLTYNMLLEDPKEGIAAFKEKRRPVWKHR